MNGTQIKLLKAHKVYDETLADQFLILAGTPRGPVSYWCASCQGLPIHMMLNNTILHVLIS